ncbi:MAG TPA: hypothetical protein VF215_09515 [Thermoanaerobaculia bacterium]
MSSSRRSGKGCLFAFGLPFAAIGVYAGMSAARLHALGAFPKFVIGYTCAAVAFSLAGFGSIAAALFGGPRAEPTYGARRISDQAHAGTMLLWGFALFWNAVATPALLFVPDEIRKGHHLAWLALLFPIVGVGLLFNALRITLRTLRFRESALVLDTNPAPIGGTLRGSVEVPHPLTSASAAMIRLIAMKRERSGSSTRDSIVCQEERELDPALIRRTADGVVIPIEIAVPADAPPSESSDAGTQVFWRLNVDVEVPGIDYAAAFDVPVAHSTFTDFRPHGVVQTITAPPNPRSYVEHHTPEGLELYFPRFRAPMRAFLSLLFAIAWIGVIAFMTVVEVPIVIRIVLALIAIPIVMATLELFFETHTIVMGPSGVTVRRRLLTSTTRVIPHAEIERANAVINAAANGARPYYRVDIETTAGKRINAAKNIRSKREAEWVASRIKPHFEKL